MARPTTMAHLWQLRRILRLYITCKHLDWKRFEKISVLMLFPKIFSRVKIYRAILVYVQTTTRLLFPGFENEAEVFKVTWRPMLLQVHQLKTKVHIIAHIKYQLFEKTKMSYSKYRFNLCDIYSKLKWNNPLQDAESFSHSGTDVLINLERFC